MPRRLPSDVLYEIGCCLGFPDWLRFAEALPEAGREISFRHMVSVEEFPWRPNEIFDPEDLGARKMAIGYSDMVCNVEELMVLTQQITRLRFQNVAISLPCSRPQTVRDLLANSEQCLRVVNVRCGCGNEDNVRDDDCHDVLRSISFANVRHLELTFTNDKCAFYQHNYPKLSFLGIVGVYADRALTDRFIARHPNLEIVHSEILAPMLSPATDHIPWLQLSYSEGPLNPAFATAMAECTRKRRAILRVKFYDPLPKDQASLFGKFGFGRDWSLASFGANGQGNVCRACVSFGRPSEDTDDIRELFRLGEDVGVSMLPFRLCSPTYARYQYVSYGAPDVIFAAAAKYPQRHFEIIVLVRSFAAANEIPQPMAANVTCRIFYRGEAGDVDLISELMPNSSPETVKDLLARLNRELAPFRCLVDSMFAGGLKLENAALCGILDHSVTDPTACSQLRCTLASVENLAQGDRCWNLPGSLMAFDRKIAQKEPGAFREDVRSWSFR